jgi:hypothetical protein
LAQELLESPFAIIVTRQPSSIKVQLAAWDIIFTLGGVGRRIPSFQGGVMENSVEGGPRAPLVAAASPICPRCKAYFRFTETFLDVRRNLIVRFFRCECGQVIWDERPA